MEDDKSQNLDGSLLPPSGDGNEENAKSEPSGSIASPSNVPRNANESDHFSHDISRMPDNPPKYTGHRRARSEIVTLPDDISFGSDLGVVGGFDGPSYSDETEEDLLSMYLDLDKFNSSSAMPDSQVVESSSSAVQTSKTSETSPATPPPENHVSSSSDRPRFKHQHSMSMDGSTTIKPEILISGPEETPSIDAKKSMSADKLAELALVDPKRAKRIWANRQSAARSKERKMRYIAELERKLQILQTEASSLSAQQVLLQRDINGLTAENNELKMRLQAMEQQIHLQDALNDTLKKEIQHLKVLTGQNLMNGGPMMSFPPPPSFGHQQFHPSNQTMRTLLASQQFQQLQIQSRKQQQHPFQLQQFPQFQQQQQLHQFQQQQQQLKHPPLQLSQTTDLKNKSSLPT